MRLMSMFDWLMKPGIKLTIMVIFAFGLSTSMIKYTHIPFLERYYAPAEARVFDAMVGEARSIAGSAIVHAREFVVIVQTYQGSPTMRHFFALALALAMVFSEAFRGVREFLGFLAARGKRPDDTTAANRLTTERKQPPKPFRWNDWGAGAAVALPPLVAVLYYGAHVLIT